MKLHKGAELVERVMASETCRSSREKERKIGVKRATSPRPSPPLRGGEGDGAKGLQWMRIVTPLTPFEGRGRRSAVAFGVKF